MSVLSLIVDELGVPDNQGRDWYAWATNQMSHSFLGVLFFQTFFMAGLPLWCAAASTALIAAAKEAHDIYSVPTWATALDSVQDFSFEIIGVILCVAMKKADGWLFLFAFCALFAVLFSGIIPRVVRAIKKAKATAG